LAAPFLRTGELVRVLESFSPSLEPFFLFYPGHRQVPAALRALIDMLRAAQPAGRRSPKNPIAKG
jgi:DNA-binding transcriptional LysR family regulator